MNEKDLIIYFGLVLFFIPTLVMASLKTIAGIKRKEQLKYWSILWPVLIASLIGSALGFLFILLFYRWEMGFGAIILVIASILNTILAVFFSGLSLLLIRFTRRTKKG